MTYDVLARPDTVTDGKDQTTTYQYDPLDRLVAMVFDDGSSIAYVYDGDGNLIETTDHTGTTTMSYDQRNNMTERSTPDGVTIAYGYDGLGNLASIADAAGTVGYSYNAANLLSAVIAPDGWATVVSYDRDYNRTAVRYPNGVSLFSTYDEAKRLTKIAAVDEKLTTLMSFEYSYEDPATTEDTALRQSVKDKDGNLTRYTYDALNRLVRARTTDPSGALLADHQYTYDGAGNCTTQAVVDADGTLSSFYVHNDANQLIGRDGSVNLDYDGNGNHTGDSDGAEYGYNASDQTTSIRTSLLAAPLEMRYRGAGQSERVSIGAAGQLLVSFTHSVLGVASETLAGTVTRRYMRDDTGQVLTQTGPTGTHYVITDGLGSTVGITDDAGALVGTLEYSPFGEVTNTTGLADTMPFRYIGAYLDPTGLYKMGERFYNPALGRFTQQDPIYDPLDPKQWNRYIYVGGDPINFADPSGLSWWSDRWDELKCIGKTWIGLANPFAPTVGGAVAAVGTNVIVAGYHTMQLALPQYVGSRMVAGLSRGLMTAGRATWIGGIVIVGVGTYLSYRDCF